MSLIFCITVAMAAARRFVGSEVGKVRADAEGERERREGVGDGERKDREAW